MIEKNKKWLIWVSIFFLIISLFLLKIDRNSGYVCGSIFWIIASLLLVDRISKEKPLLKCFALAFLLLPCFPLVLHLLLVNSEGVVSFFTSDAADKSVYTIQRSIEELAKCKTCISQMIQERDVRQMNKNFVWYLFLPGLVSCLFFLWNLPKAIWVLITKNNEERIKDEKET